MPTPHEIRAMRKKAGLTQEQLAKKAGVSQALIARIEAGTIDPRISTLRKILVALDTGEGKKAKIKDVMHAPIITVGIDEPLEKAVELMWKNGISQLPVVENGKIVGSLREETILKEVAKGSIKDLFKQKVGRFVEEGFPIVSIDMDLDEVARILSAKSPAVLVSDHGTMVGIVTKIDLIAKHSL
ncbi:MAG: CBS domain-containing protein [Candidatus Methanosuratincola petrocarbonis]